MKRRPNVAFLWSVGLHIVFGAGLLWLLSMPLPFQQWWVKHPAEPIQHIGFFQVPNRAVTTPGRNGGDNKPQTPPRHEQPIVAPTGTPPPPRSPRRRPNPRRARPRVARVRWWAPADR